MDGKSHNSMVSTLRLLLLALVALLALAGALVWSGAYDVAADVPHWPLTERLLQTVRERSMIVRERGIVVPKDLGRPERILNGAGLYAAMCTDCHLAPGETETELRRGLYPQPPAFAQAGVDDPAMAFWAIKHGVKLTAMPAWGRSHTDAQIWDMVAFLLQLKGMPAARYRALVAAAPPDEDDAHGMQMHGH